MKKHKAIIIFIFTLSSFHLYAAEGRKIYSSHCAECHASEKNKKSIWRKRIAQGKETVYKNAIEGLREMPPKGGISSLSDENVRAAVDYMVRRVGGWEK